MTIAYTLLAILEGFTEFLPVSSTAHLIILGKFISLNLVDPYVKFYLLCIQLGALLAGVLLFSKKILTDRKTFTNICVSFLPSAILGFIFYKLFKKLLEGNIVLMASRLVIGGLLFIYLEKIYMKKKGETEIDQFGKTEMTYTDALIVGLAQSIAIIPGVSRSGATIIAGIFRGIKKSVIVEYTFILAIPTLLAAVLYDTYKSRELLSSITSFREIGFGFLIAFVTGFVTLYVIRKYLPKISLTFFAWYRIVLAVVIVVFLY